MTLRGWRAYYAGGISFDSSETRPPELPDGMVGVVEFLTPPRRKIVDGADWFWFDGERWQASGTIWGGWVARPEDVPDERIKRGIALSDDGWERVRRQMTRDRSWP